MSAVTGTGAAPVEREKLLPLPGPAKLLYLAVVAAALAAAAAALSYLAAETSSWLTFAALSAAAGAAHVCVVRTGKNLGFHTGIVFVTAAALLLPPELVALIGLAPFVPEWVKERYPWYIGTFNIANFTLGALGAWAAADYLRAVTPGPDGLGFAVAGLAAALVFVFLNHFLLASMLRLGRGRSFRDSELFSVTGLATELVLATLGVALAALWVANPWVLPAVVAPLVWSHRSFAAVALLRESEGRFRAMFELAPIGSRLLDLDRRTVATNRAIERMLGYTSGELAAMPVEAYSNPEDDALDRELFAELVEGRRDYYELEKRYRARDGRTVWGRQSVSLARDADGRPQFGISMVENTTQRRQAEESLRASEERYRELFENANDMVFTVDLEGCFTAINRTGERITGYSRTELLGRRMRDLLVGDPDMLPAGRDTLAYECELTASDGRRVALEVASRVIRAGDEVVGVQGIARDVSERRALEEQLRQAQKMEAVGQLAGGVAHDFNNLLTAITGYSEFALGRLADDGSEKVRSNIQEIKKAAERASALTRQLLAFSRKQILQPKLIRPDELVGGLDDMLRRLIGTHIEILTVSRPGLGFVRADPGQLEQVIVNLAVNARDAMPDGGRLTIETANINLDETTVHAHEGIEPGSYVMLAVHDTGAGIDAQALPRIFEPFFTTKEQGKGTGLGLATVYGIVQQSGGFVTVDSEAGRGSIFRVYLPRLEGEALEVEAAAPGEPLAEGSETVLLVEDETLVRDLLREILEATGYHVLEAIDGVNALELADRHTGTIDLLLTDVVMPNMSGRDLAERFRVLRPGTKILYTSGYTDGAIADKGVLAPGTEFLQKPFSFAELTQKVRSVLDAAA